jgi:LemA protein
VAENYPDLKASQNMLNLQEELTTTENRVGFARQAFNDAVTAYNTQRQTFPCVLVAGLCGFRNASLLEAATDTEREMPRVNLG